MKKISLFIAAFMVAGAVQADVNLASGRNVVTGVDCGLLSEDVTINLTGGVLGGVVCPAANTGIALTVCHTAGRTSSRTSATDDNGDSCTPPAEGAENPDNCTAATVTGVAMPSATTLQGTVASRFPGVLTCTAATATAEGTVALTAAIAAAAADDGE
jgi:hypothetical protein